MDQNNRSAFAFHAYMKYAPANINEGFADQIRKALFSKNKGGDLVDKILFETI